MTYPSFTAATNPKERQTVAQSAERAKRPQSLEGARPTSTVERYLKGIFLLGGTPDGALVPTGRLATDLGVVPGSASDMIRSLAQDGLVRFEPYAGVRLTSDGYRLATHVLRRHRLIKLFLVEVLEVAWSELDSEAETLEHTISDQLIDRIDEMLGHPSVDPHGDPIPSTSGELEFIEHDDLLTCPLRVPLQVVRVRDLSSDFLQLVERLKLMPGTTVTVGRRDVPSEALLLSSSSREEPMTLGFRAASKILVRGR